MTMCFLNCMHDPNSIANIIASFDRCDHYLYLVRVITYTLFHLLFTLLLVGEQIRFPNLGENNDTNKAL